jgi:hypothetical protein
LNYGDQRLEHVAQLSHAYDAPLYHNFVSMTIGQNKAPVLIDSGSTIDICDSAVLQKYPFIKQNLEMPLTSEKISPVLLPNGHTLEVVGKVKFSVVLANKRVDLTFYIIPNFAYQFLLGYKTLERLNANISFGQGIFGRSLGTPTSKATLCRDHNSAFWSTCQKPVLKLAKFL